ncbi:MAG: ATP-binding protein, partial [Nitrososphaerales archaeon]
LDERVGFNHEEQLTSPDGRLRWIDFSIRPVPEGAFVLSVDETERKDAEERVLQSESRYRQLFDSSAISNWAQDMSGVKLRLDGLKSKGITDVRKYFTDHPDALREVTFSQEIVEVNESTLKMFGAKSREELIADFPKIFSYETMDATIELLATIAGGRSYWERVTKANTLDGRLIDIRVFALLPQHEEAFKNVLFSVIDITQERKARDAISESESRYRKLFDSSAVGNWSQDLSKVKSKLDALEAKGVKDLREYLPKHHEDFREIVGSMRLVDVNDTAIRMFGAKSKRELKSQVSKIFSQTPQEKTVDFLATIAEGGRYWEMENRFSTLDGGEIVAHTFSTLPNIDDENPLLLVSIIDVTETKQLEVQKLEAIGKASSSIAHDIRNPLTAIRTAGYVMRDAPTKKRGEMLDVIDTNIVKADDIIQSLMDFSSPAPLKAEEVNFKIILEEVLEQCVIPKNIRLVKRYEKVSRAKFDPRQMSRALTNLIMNAIQAMPGGGRLTIASKQDEGFIETQIKDTGIGISKKNLGKLFTPFFTTKAKGTGLGLLNAEAIIKRHGGTLELESIKNRSTTVTVRIPAISK